jgi:hypothetical protein
MGARIPERNLFELCHGTFNVERRTTGTRLGARKERTLPVLEKVEIERFAETQPEDLEVGVG